MGTYQGGQSEFTIYKEAFLEALREEPNAHINRLAQKIAPDLTLTKDHQLIRCCSYWKKEEEGGKSIEDIISDASTTTNTTASPFIDTSLNDWFRKMEDMMRDQFIKDSKKLSPFEGEHNKYNPDNVLVIGDLHEPFCLEGYLSHCIETQKKYQCGTIIFIGDLIDNHYSSYHDQDPDGYGAGNELQRATDKLQAWYKAFPIATITVGNHDRIPNRKAFSAGISERWIRKYEDVLRVPNWKFVDHIELNGVSYNHGEGGTARTRCKNELQSQVQGHIHTQGYVEFQVGSKFKIFGMQVGCGVDHKAYALAYAKNFKKQVISCAVVLNKGTLPIVIPMEL